MLIKAHGVFIYNLWNISDRREDSMSIAATVPEKMLQIQGVTRLVQATNDEKDLRIYLTFAQPVLNSSSEILKALTATDAVLSPTNRSTLGNRRFGYFVSSGSSVTASSSSFVWSIFLDYWCLIKKNISESVSV